MVRGFRILFSPQLQVRYSLNSFQGGNRGAFQGILRGDTRSLDTGSGDNADFKVLMLVCGGWCGRVRRDASLRTSSACSLVLPRGVDGGKL